MPGTAGVAKPLTLQPRRKLRHNAFLAWPRFFWILSYYTALRFLLRLFYSRRRKPREEERALVYCFGGIGDLVFATPFLESFKAAKPACRVDAIVPMGNSALFTGNARSVDRVIVYPARTRYLPLRTAWRFFRQLYLENYDWFWAMDAAAPTRFPHNLYPSAIGYVADVPRRFGSYRLERAELSPAEARFAEYAYERHSLFTGHLFWARDASGVENLLRLLSLAGIERRVTSPRLGTEPDADAAVAERLAGFAAEGELLVLFAPTSLGLSKQWHPAKFAELGNRLIADFRARIVISCGPRENTGELISVLMNGNCLSFSGASALSISQHVSLARRSHLCVGLDSGTAHIAVAVSTPVVMLFGPSLTAYARPQDAIRNRVLESPHRACDSPERRSPPCGLGPCACGAPCIDRISVDKVYDAVASLLKQEYPRLLQGTPADKPVSSREPGVP